MFAESPNRHTVQAPPRPCPACGSSQTASSTHRYDPRRGVVINPNTRSATVLGLLTWVVGTFVLNGVVPYFFGSLSSIATAIPFWVPAALAACVLLGANAVQEWRRTNAVRVDSYTCGHCGHEWSLRDGRPVPGAKPVAKKEP